MDSKVGDQMYYYSVTCSHEQKGKLMKRCLVCTITAMALLGLGFCISVWGQVADDPVVLTERSALRWDAPTENADGTPLEDLAGYRVALADTALNLNAADTPTAVADVECMDAECTYALSVMREALADGVYRAWCQAVDNAGNASEWTVAPSEVEIDKTPPRVVRRFRVVADITVEEVTNP